MQQQKEARPWRRTSFRRLNLRRNMAHLLMTWALQVPTLLN